MSDNGHNLPPRGDVDQRTWNKGVIVSTILAELVVIGAIVWAVTSAPRTAKNLPPSATGQGSNGQRSEVAKTGTGTRV